MPWDITGGPLDTLGGESLRGLAVIDLGPGYVPVSRCVVWTIKEEQGLDFVAVANRPMNETYPACLKILSSQLEEDWGDGRARLWDPPCHFISIVVRKIETEGA